MKYGWRGVLAAIGFVGIFVLAIGGIIALAALGGISVTAYQALIAIVGLGILSCFLLAVGAAAAQLLAKQIKR